MPYAQCPTPAARRLQNIYNKVEKLPEYYLESNDMKFTFVREINFYNLMDDGPANIINP
jgi:hypothetical protein